MNNNRNIQNLSLVKGHLVKRVELAVWTLDRVARQLLETTARVESKRQSVIQLTENVGKLTNCRTVNLPCKKITAIVLIYHIYSYSAHFVNSKKI